MRRSWVDRFTHSWFVILLRSVIAGVFIVSVFVAIGLFAIGTLQAVLLGIIALALATQAAWIAIWVIR